MFLSLLLFWCPSLAVSQEFTVDYTRNCFRKDSDCFQVMSGSFHYFRCPGEYWEDRISKLRASGLNTVQFYVPWVFHELQKGKIVFSGNRDIDYLLRLTSRYGLYVILRPGPFIDAAVDMGGLPWWLLRDYPDIRLRSSDKRYLYEVERYYSKLLPQIVPHLYVNGGYIISVQVENEYGSFPACDRTYMKWLRDLFRKHLGSKVLLFTNDGPAEHYLKCGTVRGVFPTVDFGTGDQKTIQRNFEAQQNYSKGGPRMDSEFYSGWFDTWGQPHPIVTSDSVVTSIKSMWSLNASFNIYMVAGGTSFGFLSGSYSSGGDFRPVATSFEYGGLLNEAGDPTDKFVAVRNAIEEHTGHLIPFPVPKPGPKVEKGNIEVHWTVSIFDIINSTQNVVYADYPLTFEQLGLPFGFVLYKTTARRSGTVLNVTDVRDRAYVFWRKNLLGIVQRPQKWKTFNISGSKRLDEFWVLIENQGRVSLVNPNDTKGMGNMSVDGAVLGKYTMYPLRGFNQEKSLQASADKNPSEKAGKLLPALYTGRFQIDKPADTFLDTEGWGKGQAYVNGINIGRYWPIAGPQLRLYLPAPYLKKGMNILTLFELEKSNCTPKCWISLKAKQKYTKYDI